MSIQLKKILIIAGHLIAVLFLLFAFLPFARWYLSYTPIWGVDFYYTATLLKLLTLKVAFAPQVWNHFWFAGGPFLSSYPILHYYLILPFTLFFDLFASIKIWMLISSFSFVVGIYALMYRLAKDHVVATILSVVGMYSLGVYGALTWGGSLPSFATQAFYPWVLFCLFSFFHSEKRIYLRLSIVLTGLAVWAHPLIVISYIFPTALILFMLAYPVAFIKRVRTFLWFAAISILIGLPLLYQNISALKVLFITDANNVARSTVSAPTDASVEVAEFFQKQPLRIFTDAHPLLFYLFVPIFIIFILNLVTKKGRYKSMEVVAVLCVLVWYTFYVWIFSYGISIYHGGWYRLFWAVPIWFGMAIAVFWHRIHGKRLIFQIASSVILCIFSLIVLLSAIDPIQKYTRPDALAQFLNFQTFGKDYFKVFDSELFAPGMVSMLIRRSQPSSAFPDLVNLKSRGSDLPMLKRALVPNWLPVENTNYRLYSADQTINIWWNALFDMPLARGYLDPATAQQKSYIFWLDAALNQDTKSGDEQLVSAFAYPKEIAQSNARFLLNWYGIKYFEAGHAGPTVYTPLPNFLTETKEYMAHEEHVEFTEKYNTGKQELHYYALHDDKSAPIMEGTNAPAVGVVASDNGFEVVVRAIADADLDSRKIIPIKLGRELELISDQSLQQMDALILYDYNYSSESVATNKINKFLSSGKNIFIETGVETKDSQKEVLPDFFPISATVRAPLGSSWDIVLNPNSLITQDIDVEQFAPPVFDTSEWKFSYPKGPSSVRSGALVILENHDYPLLVSKESSGGTVLWSGMNLFYHINRYHSVAEIPLMKNILSTLVVLPDSTVPVPSDVTFESSMKRAITVSNAQGVIFKEIHAPGWKAQIKSQLARQRVTIFSAGPAYPGFMYVKIPNDLQKQSTTVTFTYYGSWIKWVGTLLSSIITLLVLEEALLNGYLINRHLKKLRSYLHRHFKRWWVKDEEEYG